jgi:two-component system sensor histidine kinase CpxA
VTVRFPLYAKILAWFFLNLVLLAAGSWLFVMAQFRFGLDSLVAGRAGARVQQVADLVVAELRSTPRHQWRDLLARFGEAYGLEFLLFRNDGGPVVGPAGQLPPEVHERVMDRRFLPPGPLQKGEPPLLSRGPNPPRFNLPEGAPRLDGPRPEAPRAEVPGVDFNPPGGQRVATKYMLHTREPSRYWVIVRLPLVDRLMRPPAPLSLVLVSDTLRGGGLFFDFTPWLIAAGAAILGSVLLWIPLVRGITGSISEITRATERIAEGRLDARVGTRRHDELGALAGAINRMAARLEGFVGGQRRFLGDTAHELCAPIARIQMALGILEQRTDPTQKAYVEDLREEVQHMSNLVNELLSFSKASLRQREIRLEPVELAAIARRVIDREAGDGPSVRSEIPAGLTVQAEPELLARALANLVRNALRYAGHAGPISLTASPQGNHVVVSVADSGPGVPEETLQRIFDPFFRVEASRSRDTGGVGLGLAIVKTCVEACQGTVSAQNRKPTGLQVDITLQAASR